MSLLRTKIDGFYLMERMSAGGMSEVYLGMHPKTHEKRVFKIFGNCISVGLSAHPRFMREIDMVRALLHPGIIRVLDSGAMEGCYYYSMEHMPGGSLERRLGHGSIPVNAAMALFLPACAAIAYAHDCGVKHLNLKPSNILFNKRGEPVVSDFGVARVLSFEKTSLANSGQVMGTIAYLAPEQRSSGKAINRGTDVYALGAILYEMLMGFPPLGNFPKPADVHPGFPEPLQDVLVKCLAADSNERFEHAGQLELELEKSFSLSVPGARILSPVAVPAKKTFPIGNAFRIPAVKSDRIECWFNILRAGTTRERLGVVREMVEGILPSEAKAIVKLYPEEGDRVRWGLIRVLGELKIESATQLILNDLRNSFHTECAIEALGKIGSFDAYIAIRDYVTEHPECAVTGLLPLARTGKQKAIKFIQNYLDHETVSLRQAAVQALASIRSAESLQALKEQLCVESDAGVRSALFQAVHALQAVLLPEASAMQKTENIPAARIF